MVACAILLHMPRIKIILKIIIQIQKKKRIGYHRK